MTVRLVSDHYGRSNPATNDAQRAQPQAGLVAVSEISHDHCIEDWFSILAYLDVSFSGFRMSHFRCFLDSALLDIAIFLFCCQRLAIFLFCCRLLLGRVVLAPL